MQRLQVLRGSLARLFHAVDDILFHAVDDIEDAKSQELHKAQQLFNKLAASL
jgi:hypothetical protein